MTAQNAGKSKKPTKTEAPTEDAVLLDAKRRLESIIEATHLGIWEWNVQTGETVFNEVWAEIVGYTLEELAPISITTWETLAHPDDLEQARDLQEQHFAGKLPYYDFEMRMKHKDGHWVWVHDRGRVITRTDDGKPLMMFGTHTDISVRKTVEEALRESDERLRKAQRTAKIGNWEYDIPTGKVWGSEEAFRIYGIERTSEFLPLDKVQGYNLEIERVNQALVDLITRNVPYDLEFKIRAGNRDRITQIHSVAELDCDPSGDPVRVRGVIQDITERKRAEEALRESEEGYRVLVEGTESLVTRVDRDGRFTFVNQTSEKIFGLKPKECVGLPAFDFVHPDDRDATNESFDRWVHDKTESISFENRQVSRTGEVFDMRWTCTLVLDGSGQVAGMDGIAQDISERKRAEEAVQKEKSLAQEYLDVAGVMLGVLNAKGEITLCNKKGCEILGYEESELIGRNWFSTCIPSNIVDEIQGVFSRLMAGQDEPVEFFENPVVTANGERRIIAFHNTLLRDKSSRMTGILFSGEDITDRKRAEEELRKSTEMIEGIINAIPARVFWKDKQLNFLGCNAAFARDAGFAEPKDIIGKDDFQMGWRLQAESYRADDRAVIESGRPKLLIEEIQTTPAGDVISLLTSKLPLRNSEGEIDGVLGTYMDITERKRAEDVLRNEQDRMRTILDTAGDPIFVKDNDHRIILANRAFLDIFGLGEDAVMGKTLAEHVPPDEREHFLAVDRRVLDSGVPDLREETLTVGDHTHTIITRKVRFVESSGKRLLVGTIHDITERKRAEEAHARLEAQLTQAQKLESVGRLAGGVAHDFNNMLSVILGYADMALSGMDPSDPLYHAFTEIEQAGNRSAELTRQLLAFARKQVVAPKVLDLNEVSQSMLTMLCRLIGEDIDLVWKPGADIWLVNVDPAQIDQMLANMCVNARDAISGVGKVTIETENVTLDEDSVAAQPDLRSGDFVMLAVSDDGCGMDDDTKEHLFEPFFTTKGVGEGTGLGLATVYGITKQNDGFVTVYSEVGEGTTLKIYLPRHVGDAEEATESDEVAARPRGQGETVLLVEDEATVLKVGSAMLKELGYTVLTAGTPGEALALMASHAGKIDLLMTDVVMPEMNGRELAERLQMQSPGLRVLFVSGYTADVILNHGLLNEGVQFLQKPFTASRLAVAVRKALGVGIIEPN